MKKKIIKLVEKQGFIIFLFVGVCLVAGITLYTSMRGLNVVDNDVEGIEEDELVILEEDESSFFNDEFDVEDFPDLENEFAYSFGVKVEESEESEEDEETKEVVSIEGDDGEDKIGQPSQVGESEEIAKIEEVDGLEFEEDFEEESQDTYLVEETKVGILPLEGDVITEYTDDSLIYSETLEAWIGHGAIDIRGEEGSPILAVMDGEIKQVYKDDLWGIVIVIDHGDGLESKYSNLATMEMVKEGLKVNKGDHISIIGKTAKIEMHMEPHLHFELRKNGKVIDPRSITN